MFKATIVHVLVEETGWESANRTVMFCQHLWVLVGLLGTSRTASHVSCNKSRLPAPLQIRTLRLREVQVYSLLTLHNLCLWAGLLRGRFPSTEDGGTGLGRGRKDEG